MAEQCSASTGYEGLVLSHELRALAPECSLLPKYVDILDGALHRLAEESLTRDEQSVVARDANERAAAALYDPCVVDTPAGNVIAAVLAQLGSAISAVALDHPDLQEAEAVRAYCRRRRKIIRRFMRDVRL